MKNTIYRTIWTLLLALFVFQQSRAANETEYILQKKTTSVTPIFMSGHDNDPNWIKGYQLTGDIFLEGTTIGTFSTELMVLNPPVQFDEHYAQSFMIIQNSLPGIGEFTVTATGLMMGSSTFASTGDFVATWTGSVSNGTGTLENMYGLSAGNAVGSIFSTSGRMTEVLNLRSGF